MAVIGRMGGREWVQQGELLRNRYRIVRPLGQGGFAEVCLADDLYFQREVAVKRLHAGAAAGAAGGGAVPSAEQRAQLLEEARLLARVSHPNLPRVVDFFEDGGSTAIVMDYIAGETLEQIVERRGVIPQNEVLGWVRQVCDTLAYLHALTPAVIVRDLKPDNLILAHGRVYLIDFGIAKEGGASTLTRTGNRAVGTPGYCPPEQYGAVHRPGGTCPQSDYYALGATLIYLLTGVVPPDVMERISHGVPLPEVTTANGSATPQVRDAISALMELDVSKRPATVDQVRDLLGVGGSASLPTQIASVSRAPARGVTSLATVPHVPMVVSFVAIIASVIAIYLRGRASYHEAGASRPSPPPRVTRARSIAAPSNRPQGSATSRPSLAVPLDSRERPASSTVLVHASSGSSVSDEATGDVPVSNATSGVPLAEEREAPASPPQPSGEFGDAEDATAPFDASESPTVSSGPPSPPAEARGQPEASNAPDGGSSDGRSAPAAPTATGGDAPAPVGGGVTPSAAEPSGAPEP